MCRWKPYCIYPSLMIDKLCTNYLDAVIGSLYFHALF
uniref:Uncharacterized protein n=1 Tax=Anguilla anguilla TaxID=7936 RepID=A0A0E9XXT5_ANGAN